MRKYNEELEEEIEKVREDLIEEIRNIIRTEELSVYSLNSLAQTYEILKK